MRRVVSLNRARYIWWLHLVPRVVGAQFFRYDPVEKTFQRPVSDTDRGRLVTPLVKASHSMADNISVHRVQTWEPTALGEVGKRAAAFFIDVLGFSLHPPVPKAKMNPRISSLLAMGFLWKLGALISEVVLLVTMAALTTNLPVSSQQCIYL